MKLVRTKEWLKGGEVKATEVKEYKKPRIRKIRNILGKENFALLLVTGKAVSLRNGRRYTYELKGEEQ